MSEFELAQLEFMQSEQLGNILSLIQGQSGLIANDMTNFTTVLFGYLIVAYFIGGHLTRTQLWILNTLYIATAISGMLIMLADLGGLLGYWQSANELAKEMGDEGVTSDRTVNTVLSGRFILGGMLLNITLILASLYFMWSIRHPKTE
jgi:small-conductance mechanosensitive channel